MASICLYDIDLLHAKTFVPNLELMKVFNYYYQRGDVVVLGKPNENFNRFNHTIFFKQNPNTKIPKTLDLMGENKTIYGYGFYRYFTPLDNKFQNIPPNYLIYDMDDKANKNYRYKALKNGSLVRISNMDLTNFSEDKYNIYIVDYNFLQIPNAKKFTDSVKVNHKINFCFPLTATKEEQVTSFFGLAEIANKPIIVDYEYDENFFKKYYYEPGISFSTKPWKSEKNIVKFLCRIVSMIIYAKAQKNPIILRKYDFNSLEKKSNPILQLWDDIIKWSRSKDICSGYDFICQNNHQELADNLLVDKRNLRLLLKQHPIDCDIEALTFSKKNDIILL